MQRRVSVICLILSLAWSAQLGSSTALSLKERVQRHHKVMESEFINQITPYYSENATMIWKGHVKTGRLEIAAALDSWYKLVDHQRYLILSPIYETQPKVTAHYFANIFAYGAKQCVAVVHLWEQIQFDETTGLVVYHKIEWRDSEKRAKKLLDCVDPRFDLEAELPGQDDHILVEKLFSSHHSMDQVDTKKFMDFYHSQTVSLHFGSFDFSNRKGVFDFWSNLFQKIHKMYSTPAGPVIVRKRATVHASSLFVVTKAGCAYAYDLVHYTLHSDNGLFTRVELYVADKTVEQMIAEISGECGQARLPAPNEPPKVLGPASTPAHTEL